jgi:hypothetical protein
MNLIQLKKATAFFVVLACFALSAGSRAVTPAPDGGYPNDNTAEGQDALFSLTTGSDNTAIGFNAMFSNTSGGNNTATGSEALLNNTTGCCNTAIGRSALFSNTSGIQNTASGQAALADNTTGDRNTANGWGALAINGVGSDNTASGYNALRFNRRGSSNAGYGQKALSHNTTGGNNIGLGAEAGANLTTGSNNIDIGNAGIAAESNTIRIGTQGTQTQTFIAGITGTAVVGDRVAVDANGQLGTVASAARFKIEIKPMDKASEAIHALKPVSFRYKKDIDSTSRLQFGLVAEDVEAVDANLVVYDKEGKAYSVRYEAVNAMLLNEFLKEHEAFLEEQCKVQKLEAKAAQQQKQIDGLAAGIQKVSAQLELSNPAPQTAVNNH